MLTFVRPEWLPEDGIRPRHAAPMIERLRRFIGHDRLLQRTREYHSPARQIDGIRVARMRERQPLIEGFQAYERATRQRQRPLRTIDPTLYDLAYIAANYHVVAPTLSGALADHQRDKLVSLDGQLKPLLLEWKSACHAVRNRDADIAWFPSGQSGPEFAIRAGGIEWEVECKWLSNMVVELLGESEADALAAMIVAAVGAGGAQGDIWVTVPAPTPVPGESVRVALPDLDEIRRVLGTLSLAGHIEAELPGGIRIGGQLRPFDDVAIEPVAWEAEARRNLAPDARGYFYAAQPMHGMAVNPISVRMTGPRRTGSKLAEYLWKKKFKKAASQCSGQRAAVLVFEWEDLDSPEVFAESQGMQDLFAQTFDTFRHVAAIVMRCDHPPSHINHELDYSVGAFAAASTVTDYPKVAAMILQSIRAHHCTQ